MDTSNSTSVTPLNAGVKPIKTSGLRPAVTKRTFVPSEHLTHKPFEDIKRLLNAS